MLCASYREKAAALLNPCVYQPPPVLRCGAGISSGFSALTLRMAVQTNNGNLDITLDIDATYSAEDNKLRLYCSERLDSDLYSRVKEAGFKWAPKQQLFVAPRWTPGREDLCLELAEGISAEQTTLAERAEAKADRLDSLAHKRAQQANGYWQAAERISQRFAAGQPILVGHHSERKARKDQESMHRASEKAADAIKAVDYWVM